MSHSALGTLAAELPDWAAEHDWSGGVLLSQRGQVLLEASAGLADRAAGTPVTAATRFATASVTKMFTAVTVVDLVLAGRLRLDDPVVEVLPPGRRPSTLRPDVTVHHLLCHTSGIADYFEEDPPDGSEEGDYGDLWRHRPSYSMQRPVDFLPLFADLPPYWLPGERYWYSNAGYVLLGLVVEELADQPFTEVVRERVFERAGMGDSGFFRLDEVVPDLAVGYVLLDDGTWRTNVFRVGVVGGGDGGAQCTCRDIDGFLTAYDDGTLLGELHDVVLHPHADAGDGFFEGYGVHLYPDGRFGHGGGDPGVSALVHRWPEEQANLVVLANVEDHTGELRDRVLEAWRA